MEGSIDHIMRRSFDAPQLPGLQFADSSEIPAVSSTVRGIVSPTALAPRNLCGSHSQDGLTTPSRKTRKSSSHKEAPGGLEQPAASSESPLDVGSLMPRIQVNLSGNAVNLARYFRDRRGLIMGLLPTPNAEPDDDIELQDHLSTLCRLSRRHSERIDFVGCVMPTDATLVRKLAKAAQVADEVTFISDSRRKFFTKVGAVDGEGNCKQFCLFVAHSSRIAFCRFGVLGAAGMRDLERIILARGEPAEDERLARHLIDNTTGSSFRVSPTGVGTENSEGRPPSLDLTEYTQKGTTGDTAAGGASEDEGAASDVTPRTRALLAKRRTTEITKWSTSLLASSTRHLVQQQQQQQHSQPPTLPEHPTPAAHPGSVASAGRASICSSTATQHQQEMILCGYSYRDVSFEFLPQAQPFEAVVTVGASEVEIFPSQGSPSLGHCYFRGATFRTVNLHLHIPSEHMLISGEAELLHPGCRLFEAFVVHELAGGRGGDRHPLVFAVSFSAVVHNVARNELLDGILACCSDQAPATGPVQKSVAFSLDSLIPPPGEALVRYNGDLRLLEETVTWIVRRAAIEIPLSQANELLELLKIDPLSAVALETPQLSVPNEASMGPRSSLINIPSHEELYALSFAPFKHRSETADLPTTTSMAVIMREICNVGFKMFTDAMQGAVSNKPETDVLLLLLDSFTERLQTQLRALSSTAMASVQGGEALSAELEQLEEASKARRFHPLRKPLFDAFLDLDCNEWLSPALLRTRVEQLAKLRYTVEDSAQSERSEFDGKRLPATPEGPDENEEEEDEVEDERECDGGDSMEESESEDFGNDDDEEDEDYGEEDEDKDDLDDETEEEDDEEDEEEDDESFNQDECEEVLSYEEEEEEDDELHDSQSNRMREWDEDFDSIEESNQEVKKQVSQSEMQDKRDRLNRMIQMAEFMQEFDRELSVLSSFDDQTKANTAVNCKATLLNSTGAPSNSSSSTRSSGFGHVGVSRDKNKKISKSISRPSVLKDKKKPVAGSPVLAESSSVSSSALPPPPPRQLKSCLKTNSTPPLKSALKNSNHQRSSNQHRVCLSNEPPLTAAFPPPPRRSALKASGSVTKPIDKRRPKDPPLRSAMKTSTKVKIADRAPDFPDNSNEDWTDSKRAQNRAIRINARRPTGHPTIGKKLSQLRREYDKAEEEEEEDESSVNERHQTRKACRPGRRTRISERLEEDDDSGGSWEVRKEERRHRIAKRHPTGHPLVGAKAAELKRQLAEMHALGDEDEEERPTTRKPKKKGVKVVDKVHDDESDDSWGIRKTERSRRIASRHPTGHPMMASKAAQLREQLAGMDDSSDKEPPVSRTVTVVKNSYEYDSDDSWDRRKAERSRRISARHGTGHPMVGAKAAVLKQQLAMLQADLEEEEAAIAAAAAKKTKVRVQQRPVESDGESEVEGWRQRKPQRAERIARRRPTGHPAIAKRISALTAQLGFEDDVSG